MLPKDALRSWLRKPWVWAIPAGWMLLVIYDQVFPFEKNIPYSVQVKDQNGELVHAFLSGDDKWRMYAELEEITPL